MKRKRSGSPYDHLALHEDVAESEGDPENAIGRDEGRDTADRHERAVHQPACEAGEEGGGNAEQHEAAGNQRGTDAGR